MASTIEQHRRVQREAAQLALAELVAVMATAGIKLPSAAVDEGLPFTGITRVHLGSATADVITRMVEILRAGVEHAEFKAS